MKEQHKHLLTQLALLLLLLLAFGLRVYQLDAFSFWQDEGLSATRSGYTVAEILRNQILVQGIATTDTHPPLYYLLLHGSRALFGSSDFALRYPSLLASLLLLPLLYQLGRQLYNRGTGLLAAGLAAVNPLQIWYAQEARMYTLVILLAAAATYALWRALSGRRLRFWFAIYLLCGLLALLTHYTAVFLLFFQFPFWLWLLWRAGHQRWLLLGGAVVVLVSLPLAPLTIPRLFTGAEPAYHNVSPLIMLQDVVRGFNLGITVDFEELAIRLLVWLGGLLLLAGLVGPARMREGRPWRVFLVVYLLAVVAGLALGSVLKPMYLTVRHILIGSPAYLLLVALGMQAVYERRRLLLPPLALLFLLGPLLSLNNLYHDPYFAKDDVRALVRYVDENAGADDIVLYNNAILLGLHEHYSLRPELPLTALPAYPEPVTAETEARLAELAERYRRIWFIADPPVDGRDEAHRVQAWLDERFLVVDRHNVHGRGMLAALVAYDTRPPGVDSLPASAEKVGRAAPAAPVLRGWQPTMGGPAAAPAVWLDLFWDGEAAPAGTRQLRFSLYDELGEQWLNQTEDFWLDDVAPWFEGPLVRLSYGLQLPAGIPPGAYRLHLLVRDDAADTETAYELGTLAIGPEATRLAGLRLPLASHFSLHFENGLRLLGLHEATTEMRPGHPLPLAVFWQGSELSPALMYHLTLIGPEGRRWLEHTSAPGPDWLPRLPDEVPVRETIPLTLPPDAPPGKYRLQWELSAAGEPMAARPGWRPWSSRDANLGTIDLRPWPLETAMPPLANVLQAHFGSPVRIELHGYDLDQAQPAPGDRVKLTLYWRASEAIHDDYRVFVHLTDEKGEIVAQADGVPGEGLRPTSTWRAEEVIVDERSLAIPPTAAPGSYQLWAGLYEPVEGLPRLPASVDGEAQVDNRVRLGRLQIDDE